MARTAPQRPPQILPEGQRGALSFLLSRQIFLRAVAVVYLAAFLSLASQADGLIGIDGLLPVADYLASRPDAPPASLAWRYPTLLWLDSSNATIDALCLGGAMAATLVAMGLAQLPMLAACFVLYLSLAAGGQQFFLDTPWDSLLLEAGFLAIFLAPWQWSLRPSRQAEPSKLLLWLVWWLLFRVLFGSGLAKVAWGEPSWRDGTALRHYFLVQPLPVFTSWYAARLPAELLTAATWTLLFAELILPWAILLGRWGRRLAFAPLAAMQLLIVATGNYGFMNYLVLALCLSLLDDAAWAWVARSAIAPYRWLLRTPAKPRRTQGEPSLLFRWRWPKAVPVVLVCLIVPISLIQLLARTPWRSQMPAFTGAVIRGVEPSRIVNGYGLYAVMPKDRVEVVIEGSQDGVNWRPYEFRFKPGDVSRAPAFVAPHMPRVDWLMWSLRSVDPKEQPWFQSLLKALLEGRQPVIKLLVGTPFKESLAFLRVRTFGYHYATNEQRAEGYWWRRSYLFDSIGALWLRDRPLSVTDRSRESPASRPAATEPAMRPVAP